MTDTITTGTTTDTQVSVGSNRPPALPEQFAELAPYTDWIFDTWRPRYEKRLASSMDEMQAFYDAVMPHLQAIVDHCNDFDINDLPEPERNVLLLTFALCEASFPEIGRASCRERVCQYV